jgi:hypothetical protein
MLNEVCAIACALCVHLCTSHLIIIWHNLPKAEALSDPSLIEALEAEEAAREASLAADAKAVMEAKAAEQEAIDAKHRGMNGWPPSNLTLGPQEAKSIGILPHQEWRSTDSVGNEGIHPY